MTSKHTYTSRTHPAQAAETATLPAQDEGPDDATRHADWRYRAVERVQRMGAHFKINVWEQRFSADRLAPHALCYLYLQHDRRRPKLFEAAAAWHLWLDHPDVRVLPRLLFELHHQFAPRAAGAGFDIRDELSVGRDGHMRTGTEAVYAGLAVISLDTDPGGDSPTGTWQRVQKQARSPLDLPAVSRVVLTDGTVIVCHHGTRAEYSAFTVRTTHLVAPAAGTSLFDPLRADKARLLADEGHRDVLRWAGELSDTFAQADNGRITALTAAPARQSRRQS